MIFIVYGLLNENWMSTRHVIYMIYMSRLMGKSPMWFRMKPRLIRTPDCLFSDMILFIFHSMMIPSHLLVTTTIRYTHQYLSYDVAVFQWITSCNKSVMTTFLREYVTSLTTSVTTMLIFIVGNISTVKAIKSYLKSHMIKQILHSWSFHMK